MIRGVNKQVVDVTEPDSAYIERVLFFVKPDFSGLGEGALRSKAVALLRTRAGGGGAAARKPPRALWKGAAGLALAALLGAALAAAVLLALLR
ncbi:MAG: hypothetical protein IJK98_03530 [Clostridia bacterium]|nr:hypothetical protein [Clostridia bacterium]